MNRRHSLLALAALGLAACGEEQPYFSFAGGGFIFNYRLADHYYGFVLRRKKAAPAGSRLEVVFELPGGAEKTETMAVEQNRLDYLFRTPPLTGIERGHAYRARVRLIDAQGAELARYDKSFTTDVDQSTLPQDPLVVGPGYQPAPR